MRHELHAEHTPRDLLRFSSASREFDAAAFAATACMNLCLYHDYFTAELFSRVIRRFRRARHDSTRHRHTISSQQFFSLILMNLHATASDLNVSLERGECSTKSVVPFVTVCGYIEFTEVCEMNEVVVTSQTN